MAKNLGLVTAFKEKVASEISEGGNVDAIRLEGDIPMELTIGVKIADERDDLFSTLRELD